MQNTHRHTHPEPEIGLDPLTADLGRIGQVIEKALPDGRTIRYVLGDINGDGHLDQDDLDILQHLIADDSVGQFLQERMTAEELMACDVNEDGFINQADLALLCNRIVIEMERLSLTDELTGLLNRRGLKEKARLKIQAARRFGISMCCLAIDIDHFKQINDHYGHDVGDKALRHLARILTESTRTSDAVARYGGEEFVIVLDNTALEGAGCLARKLRQDVAESVIYLPDGHFHMTISIGIAEYSPSMTFHEFVKEADMALYEAKAAGRNRVVMHLEPSPPSSPDPS